MMRVFYLCATAVKQLLPLDFLIGSVIFFFSGYKGSLLQLVWLCLHLLTAQGQIEANESERSNFVYREHAHFLIRLNQVPVSAASWLLVHRCNFNLVKNHKIYQNTEARETLSTNQESLEFYAILMQVLLNFVTTLVFAIGR